MRIQNNILGINAVNNNNTNTKRLEKSINKLSSGYRINIAADDAAGFTISEKMRGQIRGLKMASRNALDAYSLMEVRDGVLHETHHMMQRMRELTIKSLSDTLTDEDREKIQKEFRALQVAITDITKKTEFNSNPVFESHEASFYSFEGNSKFDKLLKLTDGYNNDLEVSVDGHITKISIDEGYYSIGEIADIIDTKLMEKDPDLIINLTEKNNISLQSENSSSIDYIKGGLSFLFYEYHLGNPPGMIIGVTEFMENGRLSIISGSNDKLKFYVGASKEHTIDFTPKSGGYSIDELIDIINTQLEAKGEEDVRAIKYSDKHIALYSDKHVITGLSGNMIKIDKITSVLYDNAKYGQISTGQGYVAGRKDLAGGLEITKDINDTIRFKINNETEYRVIKLLEDSEVNRNYTLDELISKIYNAAQEQGIGITVDKISFGDGGVNLRLRSNYFGWESKVILDPSANGYNDLFVGKKDIIISPDINPGIINSATITGRYVIDNNVNIIAGENDKLELNLDGDIKTIQLTEGNYDSNGLIDEINQQLTLNSLNGKAELLGPSGGKYAISIMNNKVGEGSISISQSSNGFKPLFSKPYFNVLENKLGKTTIIENEEGIVGPVEIIETPAILTGRADVSSGVTIDNSNDKLIFNVSGETVDVNLDHGIYNSQELSSMLSSKLSTNNIDVSLKNNPGYGTNLIFTTQDKGDGKFFKDMGGSAYSSILASIVYDIPSTSSTGVTLNYSITGKADIGNDFVIDDNNNKFSFDYVAGGTSHIIEIELEKATYINGNILMGELNSKLESKLKELSFVGDEVSAKIDNSKIRLESKNSGPDYKLNNFNGNFYDAFFKKTTTNSYYPYSYSGYSNSAEEQSAYIVGRENINKEMVINPYVNDIIIFDFYHNSNKKTFELRLEPGLYDGNSIISEIQNKLNIELVNKGLEANMLRVQIGGVDSGTSVNDENKLVIKFDSKNDGKNYNGSYIIDGVRGNAAYTIFYKAMGEPSPTHTVGIADLSSGASIKTGVNDVFTMDINGEEKTIVLEEKDYTPEELLNTINIKLNELPTDLVASYFEGRLKLSFSEVGANTIDGIRGNGKDTLFFESHSREYDVGEYFQIGANSGDAIIFNKSRISSELMRINTVTIHKTSFANKALERLDKAISYVSAERGRIGATQNRLESIISNNQNYEENLTAAESRIRDVDMAKEAMELMKQQILHQASQAMLAQANNEPKEVLKLLE